MRYTKMTVKKETQDLIASYWDERSAIAERKAKIRHLDIRYDQCPCEKIFYENDTFDTVINCRVMWTLPDPEAAVREWIRILKPGGKVISFMRMMDMSGGQISEIYGEEIDFPLRGGDRKDYTDVYERAGLKDIKVTELPEALSSSDMPHWTAFSGIKTKE